MWQVVAKRGLDILPLAGPFRTPMAAWNVVPWCISRATEIDAQAPSYQFEVEKLPENVRGVFTPRGDLFTPWFEGLLP